MTEPDLSTQLAPGNRRGLLLGNPVMAASGTFGYGIEYAEIIDVQKLGAIVSKGITPLPREGNPSPRLMETPSGLLNSIGLENIGAQALIREKAPVWARWEVPVIVNIAGESVQDYTQLAKDLDGVEGISALEVNISCPNVSGGGMEFGVDPAAAAAVTSAVRAATELPVIVKLTPNVTDITVIARAVAEAGADCLTVANTFRGMAIDTSRRRAVLDRGWGGLSGPAIRPLALQLVFLTCQAVRVPVIGCGGIVSTEDALQFLMAGASAVQVGTATFADPGTMLDIIEGIRRFMEREKIARLGDLIGAANVC